MKLLFTKGIIGRWNGTTIKLISGNSYVNTVYRFSIQEIIQLENA